MNNKIIKTPKLGVEIELKEWISGEEGEIIDSPMTDIKIKINASGQTDTDINVGEATKKSTANAVNIIVLKVDNKEGEIWERIRKMPNVDYKFILKEVDNIVRGKDFIKPVLKQKDGIA